MVAGSTVRFHAILAAMKRKFVVFVALGACVDIPPFAPQDAVTWTDSNGGGTITSKVVTMHFAEGTDKLHLPDELRFTGGDRLIGESQTAPCNGEDQLGVALYPAARMSADTPGAYGTNGLQATLRGPAVVKVEMSWGASFTCGATARSPNGYAVYTMFPDGMITRYDELSEDTPPTVDANSCTCGPGNVPTWAITSFWTFNRIHLNNIEYAGTSHQLPTSASGMQLPDKIVCVDDGQRSITLSTMNATTRVTTSAPTETFALVHDMRYFETMSLGDLQPQLDHVQTAAFVDPTQPCATTTSTAPVAFGSNDKLTINGTPVERSVDGIYGGLDRGSTTPGFAIDGSAKLQGPVGLGYAVWLRFASDADSITVVDPDKSGDPNWYVPQQVDSTSWVIWFRDPLTTSEIITVTAR
jgi:hypothetical protein